MAADYPNPQLLIYKDVSNRLVYRMANPYRNRLLNFAHETDFVNKF